MRYKPKSIAALQVALGGLPDAMHVEADRGIWCVGKNGRRTSQGRGVARQLGDNDPAGTLSRERNKGEQDECCDARHAKTVASVQRGFIANAPAVCDGVLFCKASHRINAVSTATHNACSLYSGCRLTAACVLAMRPRRARPTAFSAKTSVSAFVNSWHSAEMFASGVMLPSD
jgi:hypothetical protein